jgi:hypothetical protein
MFLSQKLNQHFDSGEKNLWPILNDLGGYLAEAIKNL